MAPEVLLARAERPVRARRFAELDPNLQPDRG